MKKLFISVPMRNRTEYAIKASMEQMHKIRVYLCIVYWTQLLATLQST